MFNFLLLDGGGGGRRRVQQLEIYVKPSDQMTGGGGSEVGTMSNRYRILAT